MVFKSSQVWTMSTDELIEHLAGLDAPDQIYWDARELKKSGRKFQNLSWDNFPRATKKDGVWTFVNAAPAASQAEAREIKPAWAAYTPGQGIDGFAKISIGGEAFWVRVESHDEAAKRVIGRVDNDLVATDVHGIKRGDRVAFTLTERPTE